MTKTEAQKMFEQTIITMYDYGFDIPVSKIEKNLFFNNATSYLGQCRQIKKNGKYVFRIYVSKNILNGDEDVIRDTIAHEIIHTIKGCFNHKTKFKENAYRANVLLGWNVTVRATEDECIRSGLNEAIKIKTKYIVYCPECGAEWKRQRKCSLVNNPENWHCGKCKTSLKLRTA